MNTKALRLVEPEPAPDVQQVSPRRSRDELEAELERLNDLVKQWSPIVLDVALKKFKHAAGSPGRKVKAARQDASAERAEQRHQKDPLWERAEKTKAAIARAKQDEPPT